ncbi:hypothetical protein V8E55_002793 [Tylopilus felleus]
MYGGSRIVLGILTLYVVEMVPLVIASIIIDARLTASVAQVLDFSFCVVPLGSPTLVDVSDGLGFSLAAVMFLLVVAKFLRHSFQMEGVLYFLATLLFGLTNVLFVLRKISATGWQVIPIAIVEYVPVFTLTPRFILSVRALYARDLQGGSVPHDIDTEFGFTLVSGGGIRESVIVFAEPDEEGLEQDEEISMEEMGIRSTGSGV